jgi:hypothetical protein
MNTQEFINKLNKINFTSVEDRKTLVSEDGFKLSYRTKFSALMGNPEDCYFVNLPIQLIFQVTKDGQHVQSWGCVDLEDTTVLAKWYKLKKSFIQIDEDDRESKSCNVARNIWNNL